MYENIKGCLITLAFVVGIAAVLFVVDITYGQGKRDKEEERNRYHEELVWSLVYEVDRIATAVGVEPTGDIADDNSYWLSYDYADSVHATCNRILAELGDSVDDDRFENSLEVEMIRLEKAVSDASN